MFADLGDKLSAVFKRLRGETRITEKNVSEAVKEVRMALLEADVNYKVVKSFVGRVEARALGAEVFASVTPGQQFIKIVQDELTETLGGADYSPKINLSSNPPTIILMSGLQGSGKTTSSGKLARQFIKSGRSVLLVACDIYRPAAIDQLEVVGKQVGADVYTDRACADAVKIALDGVAFAKKAAKEVVIVDTAGRLHIDDALMAEILAIKAALSPHAILYVADAMSGQDAVNSAKVFNDALDITGVVLTKTDGDARGGAALSVKEVTGKPLMYIGTGEKLDEFELFHPSRMAGRILGMGDIVSLVEKAGEAFDGEDPEALAKKIQKSGFNFEDMLQQFRMIKKMGSFGGLMKLVPGLGSALGNIGDIDDSKFAKIEAIIYSMTLKERRNPGIINSSRKKRIATGSGTSVQDMNRLLKQLDQMNKMMKQMGKMAGKKGGNPLSMFKGL